jgi:hypothetical protein
MEKGGGGFRGIAVYLQQYNYFTFSTGHLPNASDKHSITLITKFDSG